MPVIRADGVDLFYDLHGPPDAPVLAFSNSIGSTLEIFEAQAAALAGPFRVLRYDARGHGRSAVVDEPATIEQLAGDLRALLDALKIPKVHLVGLSLGGMTAQCFAATWPERVDRLVLIATAAHMQADWDQRIALIREHGMAGIVDTVMPRWFAPGFLEGSAAGRAVREGFLRIDPRGYAAAAAAIRDMDLRPLLGRIAAPTLLVAGALDPGTPPAAMATLRDAIPDAELVVLPRGAHILSVERPDAVNRHLRAFLGERGERPQGGATFESGLANRRAVLGAEHVDRSLAKAGPFAMPWQDFITRTAWGEVWGDPTLPWKTRSLLTLAMMVALGREEEFKLHVRPALRNGVSREELRALLLQTAIYAGVPAANGAFRWAKDVLGEDG